MSNAADFLPFRLEGLPDPELDRQFYAGVPSRRIAAWCVDFVLIVAISLVVVPLAGIFTLGLGFVLAPLVFVAIAFAYRVATLAQRSATWGMRLFGIELRRGDGQRLDPVSAATHTLLHMVSVALPVILLGSLVTLVGTRRRQTLPDIALGTAAINRPED